MFSEAVAAGGGALQALTTCLLSLRKSSTMLPSGVTAWADSGRSRLEVFRFDFGDQPLQGPYECPFVVGPPHLAQAHLPVFQRHFSKTGITEGLEEVLQVQVELAVSFSPECENGIRSAFDRTVDHSCEMHAEERKLRIGYRVNEVFAKALGFLRQFVVLPLERNDLGRNGLTGQPGHPIRMKARAVDQKTGFDFSLLGLDQQALRGFFDLANFLTEQKFIVVTLGNQLPHAARKPDDSSRFRIPGVDGPDACRMGLDLEKSFPVDDFAIYPIFLSPPEDLFHTRNFFFAQGHDDLAAKFVLDPVFLAKILHGQFAFAAIDRLEGTGFVINSGMKDAGIMSGLVLGQK